MKDIWVLKHLVRLCDSVGWFKANVGQKCLYAIHTALYLDKKEIYIDQPEGLDDKESRQKRRSIHK